MSVPPQRAAGGPVRDRSRNGLSIAVKLPLFIGALIVLVIALNTWGDYRSHLAEEQGEAVVRLANVAGGFVETLVGRRTAAAVSVHQLSQRAPVERFLSSHPARPPEPVITQLRVASAPSHVVAAELRDTEGRLRLRAPGGLPDTALTPAPSLLRAAGAADSVVFGPFRFVADSVVYPVVARVMTGGVLTGYAVQWRRLFLQPVSGRQVPALIGRGGRVYIGNRNDSVWTDLTRPAAPPPTRANQARMTEYSRPNVGAVLSIVEPVPGTPWAVSAEFPKAAVRAPVLLDVQRLFLVDLVVLLIGLIGAWLLSRRVTRRLLRLTMAAESMATAAAQTEPRRGGDEVRRLGHAFDRMQDRVTEALAGRAATEELYRGIFEAVPLPLYVAELDTLRFLAVNTAAVEQYGYSREEFASMTLRDIRPPADIERLETTVANMGGRPQSRGIWQHHRKDGSLLEVEIIAHTITFDRRPAALTLAMDVTARHRAAEALRRSEERYRRLIQESPYGIELSSLDGRLLDANPALARLLGYDGPEELIGRDIHELYVDPAERQATIDQLDATGHARRESLKWKRRDGHTITVRFTARLVHESDRGEPYIESIVEDVTERLQLEERFHQAQKMEAVGRLAGGIAHDFNNLLTVILTTTELLLESAAADGPLHAELQDVYRSAQRGADLTRQLLAFSRRQVLSIHPLSVNHLLSGMERLLTRLLGEDIDLEVIAGASRDTVRADAGQFEQVVMNLAVNARDAMPQGGRLTIETAEVELAEPLRVPRFDMPAGSYVGITVSDSGHGMTADVQSHLFEPFFTTKGKEKGTGLGLATVYGIVKQLGGFIWCTSEPGTGTSFQIYLPRVNDSVESGPAGASSAHRTALDGTETILLAEDEDSIRSLLTRVLHSRGYTVLAGASGEEALSRAVGHRAPIDLLVTDVVMAGMSGPELATAVVRSHPEVRVLFLSGYTDEAVVQHGLSTGQASFLQKPFTHTVFLAKVREVLGGGE